MTYELKKYVDESYDFNSVFPDKVKSVQEITGMNFSLQEIVDFLQVQTSDFTVDNVIAKDLDTAIVRLIEKQQKPASEEQGEKSKEEKDKQALINEWTTEAESYYDLLSGDISDFYSESIEEWKASLDLLVGLFEDENYDIEAIKKYKSVL